jgi:hypothetical protein
MSLTTPHASAISKTYLPLATGHGDVDETTSILEALHGAALGELLLLLGLDLYDSRETVSLGFQILKFASHLKDPMQHRNQPQIISRRLPSLPHRPAAAKIPPLCSQITRNATLENDEGKRINPP